MIETLSMILIGIGANLPHPDFGTPRATCEAAVEALDQAGLTVFGTSNWYKSAPVPASSQPWYINGVIAVETSRNPEELLSLILSIEDRFGRIRGETNAARTLDLDLIAYGDTVLGWDQEDESGLIVPHPRMHERGFVLLPLRDIAPAWRHPALHQSLSEMIDGLDPNQRTMLDN